MTKSLPSFSALAIFFLSFSFPVHSQILLPLPSIFVDSITVDQMDDELLTWFTSDTVKHPINTPLLPEALGPANKWDAQTLLAARRVALRAVSGDASVKPVGVPCAAGLYFVYAFPKVYCTGARSATVSPTDVKVAALEYCVNLCSCENEPGFSPCDDGALVVYVKVKSGSPQAGNVSGVCTGRLGRAGAKR
jgi:hypothetical protein